MELLTLAGVGLGFFAVVGGALLEGLNLSAILQGTAALIVFGGTFGAVLVSYPRADIKRALALLKEVFKPQNQDIYAVIDEIVRIAAVARKEGILALDQMRESIQNPMFRKGIKFVIDGFEPATVAEIMAAEIELELDEQEAAAKVWEGCGGYAPTVGILGAVLGLIHVMENLQDPSKLGEGIAVAFVATVYGVASANLLFLPFGAKIKRNAHLNAVSKQVVRIGVIGIQEGLNPLFLREKLEVHIVASLQGKTQPGEKGSGQSSGAQGSPAPAQNPTPAPAPASSSPPPAAPPSAPPSGSPPA